ncbi:uncharacterized protein NECHADRAFT_72672 [Fusarium vanettenii 77-13-4]|uniref:ER transporter 6TM N-terminal domain-containing protein n=1 Tax=Fusarium vanettenii (strain ATCC MYA-4622 / CBS 123669 / FGSC 9596 / NRRL 45880 / 77-13-4) TaxID=660122 RepID=C7ZH56_FUSV7|nr:uncharacterized protein NECHADRAFT_72672 [Fusarium vanettenii 77-13-4]EEU36673.1 hypothetical protein NECHADRAFT_72672 [Fusarium vanettenii 77-13-4]
MADSQEEQFKQPRLRQLPKWLDHFNLHDLKIFFRCWAAVWISMLLIFIDPALQSIGLASFLAAILLFIVPPASILFVYLLAALSLLLGMCLAWAWGLLTMKAAFAARPDLTIHTRLATLQEQAVAAAKISGQSVAWEAQKLVHKGFLIDTRVVVVFYVMGCFFIYVLARLRCANPKLIVMQIFGTIVTDIFILVGPTVPSFLGSLASVLVKPGAVGAGLGAACCVLFFPQSTSYVVLGQVEKLVRMTDKALDVTRKRLADQHVSLAELRATRANMIAVFKAIQPSLAFLPLDFSRGRWNSDDVHGLQGRVREVMFASLYLIDFHIARIRAAQKHEDHSVTRHDKGGGRAIEKEGYEIGQRHRFESANLMEALQTPETATIRSRTRMTLEQTTSEVLQTGSEAIKLASNCIHAVNSCRWFGKPSQSQFDELARHMQDALANSRAARQTCIVNTTKGVLETHAGLFDENGRLKHDEGTDNLFLPGIVISMVVEERILNMAEATEKLLDYILQLSQIRTSHRIWIPYRFQYAISWLFNGRLTIPVSGTANEVDPDLTKDSAVFNEQTKEARRRLEITRVYQGSSSRRNPLSRVLIATYEWLTNPAGMFALRMVIVTIATSIPASIPRTAGFFYREKGIWAVISAQTCLVVYLADFTFSLVARTLGTVLGGVMGMVAWYIGSGHGPGNPYGMGAITAVMLLPLMWWRIFLPPAYAQASIMAGATFALVVGFSWDHDHIQQYGLPGKGEVAFWKRLVTVLIGFAAAFIVQLFPSPPSATTHVCKTLANSVRTLSDHYALLISHWGRADQNPALSTVAEEVSIEVAEVLMSLSASIGLLKGELSFGPFNQQVLRQAQEQCQYMNQALGSLLKLAGCLPKELQERLVRTAGILDDRSIGDIMAVLGIIEQAFRTGSPLPERLPAPLVRRAIESYLAQGGDAILTTALVKDENHRRYCVVVTLYLKFLTSIDDLLLVLKAALGERHIIYQWEDA